MILVCVHPHERQHSLEAGLLKLTERRGGGVELQSVLSAEERVCGRRVFFHRNPHLDLLRQVLRSCQLMKKVGVWERGGSGEYMQDGSDCASAHPLSQRMRTVVCGHHACVAVPARAGAHVFL